MKTAILLHGARGSDQDYYWFADTKAFLESNGYQVWWPLLPNTQKPELHESLKFVMENMPELSGESVIIGHSSGCPLIFSLLERIEKPIASAILVGGFYRQIDDTGFTKPMLQDEYDWQKIRDNAKNIYLLNSDDDPWGCDDRQAYPVAERLQVPLIVMFGQGRMGSQIFKQPYQEFPLVKQLIQKK